MIIHRYILRAHLYPFIFSFFTLISVFLLQFLMKFADKLVGKGISLLVVAQLITYSLAWMVVLVGPMAVLIATLMAFGGMTQDNEVAILKATGMSLYKMMIAPFIAACILAFLLIQFNNYVYPNANHATRILMQDISRKKPTLSLVPGVFSQDVPKYSILVREIDQQTNRLKKVTIYDHTNPSSINVVTADHGKIYFSADQTKLIMDLYDGEIHESAVDEQDIYRKLLFDRHRIAMDADQFAFQQSSFGGTRGERELSAQDMIVIVDSLNNLRETYRQQLETRVESNFDIVDNDFDMPTRRTEGVEFVILSIKDKIRAAENTIASSVNRLENNTREINKYWVEIHKKYSLPFACIVFILIGAPLGTMTRKGGFGVAAGISLLFFLIYWAFLIGGEKLADRGLLSPFWGMWSANIVLTLLGIYLTVKAAKERVTIDLSFLQKLIPKQLRSPESNEDS